MSLQCLLGDASQFLLSNHGSEGAVGSTGIPVGVHVFNLFVSSEDANKFLGIVEDFYIAKLELVVDDGGAESKHLHKLAFALVAFVLAGEGSPVTPCEGNLGRARVHLQNFPRECRKGIMELVVALLPGGVCRVPSVGRACIEQDIVVSNLRHKCVDSVQYMYMKICK